MNRIRELREANGWTQTQLGKRIGMAKTTITGYEREDRQPTPATICAGSSTRSEALPRSPLFRQFQQIYKPIAPVLHPKRRRGK